MFNLMQVMVLVFRTADNSIGTQGYSPIFGLNRSGAGTPGDVAVVR